MDKILKVAILLLGHLKNQKNIINTYSLKEQMMYHCQVINLSDFKYES